MAHVPGAPKKAWWAISTVLASVVVVAALIAVRIQPVDEGKAQPAHGDVQGSAARDGPHASEPLPLLEPSEALHSLAAPEGGEWRVVSQLPRIYVHDDFLSDSECETLKQQVAGRLEPAKVVQKADNKFDEQVSVRNNKQIWLNYTQEKDLPEVFHLLKRMHRAARIPDDDAEALQIGLYGPGEKYETHQDSDPQNDVARPATFIVYLNDVAGGGETLFPLGNRDDCTMQWRVAADGSNVFGASACCDRDDLLRISPKKGRAVLFFNHDPAGQKDRMAEHAACPVKQGEKWIAQRWFRYEPYQRLVHPLDLRFDGLPLSHQPSPATSARGDIRILSQKMPSVYVIEDFLSSDECELLIDLAPQGLGEGLTRRRVMHAEEAANAALERIAKRLHRAVRIPETHGQPLEFIAYPPGGFLRPHVDTNQDGSIQWTAILYLTGDGSLGKAAEGATIFPDGWCRSHDLHECCALAAQQIREAASQRGDGVALGPPLAVPPSKGRALLFRSSTASGMEDPTSRHGSCPAGPEGKMVAQKWFGATPSLAQSPYQPDHRFDGLQ